MKEILLTDIIPNDILRELESTLSDFFGSPVGAINEPPEEGCAGISAPVMLNGQVAGYFCAKELKATKKNTAFMEGIARILSKLLYHRYLQSQRTESMERNIRSQAEFMTQFADDVKSSVSEMILYLSGSSAEEGDNDINKSIDVLMARTLKLGNMIEANKDYVDVMSGVFELNEAVYSIRDVVENQISLNMEKASQKNDTLTCSIAEDVPERLMGDPGHVGTIIGKLVENSIRFTENNFADVAISVEKSTYGCILVIKVTDGGGGIDPGQAEYIKSYMESRGFSDAKNEEFEMLGFSLIGFCVNAMSGSIELETKPGESTVFEIRLPQLPVHGGDKNEL